MRRLVKRVDLKPTVCMGEGALVLAPGGEQVNQVPQCRPQLAVEGFGLSRLPIVELGAVPECETLHEAAGVERDCFGEARERLLIGGERSKARDVEVDAVTLL